MNDSDYSHRFHAGNHADVLKHVLLLALLAHHGPGSQVLDTHAGHGQYRLGPTGEWTAGIGRLWAAGSTSQPLIRYLDALKRLGAGPRSAYPGSPLLCLDAGVRHLSAHEVHPEALADLSQALGDEPRATVRATDGYEATPLELPAFVLMDPPYAEREDWTRAPASFARLCAAGMAGAMWYPIKSWNRPNQLHQRLRDLGVPFVAIDLIVTPLELKRPQLAGSGMAIVGASPEAIAECAAAANALGPLLATHGGRYSLRLTAA